MSRLEEIALEYGLCNCDEAYTSRNLTAPDCPFHAFAMSEAMEKYATECCKATLEKASKNVTIDENFSEVNINHWIDKESITNPDNIILL